MYKGLTYFAIFAAGIGTGVVATKQYFKNYYEERYQEDVSSVKEVFARNKTNDIQDEFVNDEQKKKEQDLSKYSNKLEKLGYAYYSSSNIEKKPAVQEPAKDDRPYVIAPDEFGELDDYDIITLNYYEGDDVLTDDCDELLDDPDGTVGLDSLDHFGDYEDDPDVVYVRNDRLKAYFQIVLDARSYEDVIAFNR